MVLERFNIGINDAINGVFFPSNNQNQMQKMISLIMMIKFHLKMGKALGMEQRGVLGPIYIIVLPKTAYNSIGCIVALSCLI